MTCGQLLNPDRCQKRDQFPWQESADPFVGAIWRASRGKIRLTETNIKAIRKSAPATSPGSVYSQRCSATCGGGPADTSSVARPSPKLDDPHPGRDRPDGHGGEKSPGSLWRPLDPVVGQSHEAANRKRFLVRCPLAPLA